jgi:hypothetical protein
MNALIDPEELPFTAEEIFQAACTFLPAATARMMADHLASIGPDLVQARVERRLGWERGGIPHASKLPLYGWVYPEELLRALAALSPELKARVDALQRFLRQGHLPGTA